MLKTKKAKDRIAEPADHAGARAACNGFPQFELFPTPVTGEPATATKTKRAAGRWWRTPYRAGDPHRLQALSRVLDQVDPEDDDDVLAVKSWSSYYADEVSAHINALKAHPDVFDPTATPRLAAYAAGLPLMEHVGFLGNTFRETAKEFMILAATVAHREAGGKPDATVESVMTTDHTVVLRVLERAGQSVLPGRICSAADTWFDHPMERTSVNKLLKELSDLRFVERRGGEKGRKGYFIAGLGRGWLDQHPPLPESH